jgi:hypothetical protein
MTKVFEQMVTAMQRNDTPLRPIYPRIKLEDYELWKQDFTWEALHGQRYGQSFCNRFGLHDNHLYYNTGDIEWADAYIKKTYLERT